MPTAGSRLAIHTRNLIPFQKKPLSVTYIRVGTICAGIQDKFYCMDHDDDEIKEPTDLDDMEEDALDDDDAVEPKLDEEEEDKWS